VKFDAVELNGGVQVQLEEGAAAELAAEAKQAVKQKEDSHETEVLLL